MNVKSSLKIVLDFFIPFLYYRKNPSYGPSKGSMPAITRQSKSVGRPCILTPKMHQDIVKLFEEGHTRPTVAAMVSISYECLSHWIKRGLAATSQEVQEKKEERFLKFYVDVKKAERTWQAVHVKRICDASKQPKHWTASAWLLERKFPNEWGRKETLQHTTPNPLQINHTHTIDLSTLSEEDLLQLREIALRSQRAPRQITAVIEDVR